MSKRTSIGSWAYTIGPYASNPIDFDTVCDRLKELGFEGVELGAFPPHPNPGNPWLERAGLAPCPKSARELGQAFGKRVSV
jgi:sugar phosphate isomerase/epimerase